MNKASLFCAVLLFVALLGSGEAVKCYKCESCDEVDEKTETCVNDYCVRFETTTSFDSFCTTDKDYCVPHESMPHDCFVCEKDLCNSAYSVTSSVFVAATLAAILRFFH